MDAFRGCIERRKGNKEKSHFFVNFLTFCSNPRPVPWAIFCPIRVRKIDSATLSPLRRRRGPGRGDFFPYPNLNQKPSTHFVSPLVGTVAAPRQSAALLPLPNPATFPGHFVGFFVPSPPEERGRERWLFSLHQPQPKTLNPLCQPQC